MAQKSQKVGGLAAEIAASSKEQACGIMEIKKAVGEIERVVQNNVEVAPKTAAASDAMVTVAKARSAYLDEFIAAIKGDNNGD